MQPKKNQQPKTTVCRNWSHNATAI